jgi:hypothetical protein
MRLLNKNIREMLFRMLVWTKIFFRYDPKTQATKAKIDKWDYTKQKLCTAKGTINSEETACKV